MSSPLVPYIIRGYAEAKQRYPTEGRRKWKLRIAEQFWTTISSDSTAPSLNQLGGRVPIVSSESAAGVEPDSDPDPLDGVVRDAALGLIDSEKDLVSGDDHENASKQPVEGCSVDEEDSDDEEEGAPPAIFHLVNAPPQERELLVNASNLTVLRLFNDVDVRPSPTPPLGTKRINPPNKLVDYHGWQEIYQGKNVWIYDTKSNADQCARVVSQSGDMYGTATGDSWRARVSHICELQVNLSAGAIRIDFGGLDKWDFGERKRNMMEAGRV